MGFITKKMDYIIAQRIKLKNKQKFCKNLFISKIFILTLCYRYK